MWDFDRSYYLYFFVASFCLEPMKRFDTLVEPRTPEGERSEERCLIYTGLEPDYLTCLVGYFQG